MKKPYIDLFGNQTASLGDTFQLKVTQPGWTSNAVTYHLTPEEIRMLYVTLPPIQLERLPEKSALLPSYPNPGNPEIWIPFRLHQETEVTIEIYNVAGQLVRMLTLGRKAVGNYIRREQAAYWDGTNDGGETVTSGIYFYLAHFIYFTYLGYCGRDVAIPIMEAKDLRLLL